ncbi:hypothetical protein, partial [Streptomyces tubercidicus]|uniref:hypothetical protein n=1 Tax=Streptomyces tubercidicus TaxID=47759 RepID=UPI0036874D00
QCGIDGFLLGKPVAAPVCRLVAVGAEGCPGRTGVPVVSGSSGQDECGLNNPKEWFVAALQVAWSVFNKTVIHFASR